MPENDAIGISPLLEVAIAMHETFNSLVQAGFSEEQALKIIVEFSKGN